MSIDPATAVQARMVQEAMDLHLDLRAVALNLVESAMLFGWSSQVQHRAAVARMRATCMAAPEMGAVPLLDEFLETRQRWSEVARLARIR